MRVFKLMILAPMLMISACDDITITAAAEEGLRMCRAAALRLIEGSGGVEFPSSFHDPFRDPTVVRLRYLIKNSGATGTIRCYYDEDTDDRRFIKIELDGNEVASDQLQTLTATAKNSQQ